jgi:hypothetical protein
MTEQTRKPLINKLGIRPGDLILILNPPDYYPELLGELPEDVNFARDLQHPLDFVQYFAQTKTDLVQALPGLKQIIAVDGALWICWLQQAASAQSDLTETTIREMGSSVGLVDVKVVAIDENWSALKFIYRLEDR